jgi:putative transposase
MRKHRKKIALLNKMNKIEHTNAQDVCIFVKLMKGRSSRKLQIEFSDLKKRYWGRHVWAIGFGC